MNRWHIAGESLGLYVEFRKDGEFMPPDSGSIKLTIRDNSGSPISSYNRAAQADVSGTSVLFTVPQSVNVINEGVETRYVQVDFTVAGVPCVWKDTYRLSQFIPLNVLPEDVRNILGARDKEVTDEEVDLYEAYFSLLRSNSAIAAALTATSDIAMYANRAVALKAALILIPSMPVRTMKQDSLNNATLLRATIDWVALESAIRGELTDALGSIDPTFDGGFILNAIFVKTNPTDPVTNA